MVLNYFKSRTGRKVVFVFAGSTTIGLFFVNYAPHTFGLERYRKFVQCYRNEEPMALSAKLIERLNEAADVLEIGSSGKKIIYPFPVFGLDLFSAGSTKSRFGAIIGIPLNYEFDSVEDMESSDVRFRNMEINWNTEGGKLLKKVILLTKDEQLFGLCKMLLQCESHHVLLNSIFPSFSFLMVYSVGHILNQSLNLLSRPPTLRMFMYAVLSLFGVGLWSFMKDYNQVSYDIEIDKKLASINRKYIEAGVGFYNKQLTKNMALKELVNDNSFTAKGNVNYFLRQKSLPLTVRKSFFDEKLKQCMEPIG